MIKLKQVRGIGLVNRRGKIKIKHIIARHGNLCFYCLKSIKPHQWSREHIKSLSRGGKVVDLSNVVLAHKECNRIVGDISVYKKWFIRFANLSVKKLTGVAL